MRKTSKWLLSCVLFLFALSMITGCIGESSNNSSPTEVSQFDSPLTEITITPQNLELGPNKNISLNALAKHEDGTLSNITQEVDWSTSNTTIAQVNEAGILSTRQHGTVDIIAKLGEINGFLVLTVTEPLTIDSISLTTTENELHPGESLQCQVTALYPNGDTSNVTHDMKWISSRPDILGIDSNGLATAYSTGIAFITALHDYRNDITCIKVVSPQAIIEELPPTTLISLSLIPSNVELVESDSTQFRAEATYSDSSIADVTTEVSWQSLSPDIATTTELGMVNALSPGVTNITATFQDSVASATLNVESLIDPSTLPSEELDSTTNNMLQEMLSIMSSDPQGMIDMIKGMLTFDTIEQMFNWLAQPDVLKELLEFLLQSIRSAV